MRKLIAFPFLALLLFTGVDCKDEPVQPPTNNDTTSHNFTWQTFTWGGGGASSINDVAIINDTNIWAVGEIQFTVDSTYNAVHWNGHQWEFLNIPTERFGGTIGNSRLNTIIAFNPNDIWTFSIAGSYSHWDGMQWTTKFVPERSGGGTKFWGTSSSNLYLVGTNGSITYYNGSSWQKVESGTTYNFQDIYGAKNIKTDEWEILALATQYDTLPAQTQLLRIQGTTVKKVETFPTLYFSVWFVPGEKYFLSGDGILWKNKLTDASWTKNPIGTITQNTSGCIRGNNRNDFFVSQLYLDVIHYNGSTWHDYVNEIPGGFGSYPRLALKGNTMVAGGWMNQDAVLLLGKRE